MDEVILNNLEKRVKPHDTLYLLGDLTFKVNKALEFFERFSAINIHYIIGNHDSKKVIELAKKNCVSVTNLKDIKVQEQSITLCHYAMRVWNKSHFNAWQLYGHSHATLDPIGKQYDVGVDNNNFFPVSYDTISKIMKKKPNNFNYIPPEKRR
jgi:calcineurin-like phosphoesterase family protein